MSDQDQFLSELARLRLKESAAIGTLKGNVAALLLWRNHGLEINLKHWERLAKAYEESEAAANAVMDFTLQPFEVL
jgi:hypothetical protein